MRTSFQEHLLPPPVPLSIDVAAPTRWRSCFGERCVKVLKGCLSLVTTGLGIGIRSQDYSPAANALSSVAIGFGAQSAINTYFSLETANRVDQVCGSMFGIIWMWFATYLWDNDESRDIQAACITAIEVGWGAIFSMYVRHIIHEPSNRIESDEPITPKEGVYFSGFPTFYSPRIGHPQQLKAIAAIGCGSAYLAAHYDDNVLAQGMLAFIAMFYAAQTVAEVACDRIDRAIHKASETKRAEIAAEGMESGGIIALPYSRLRMVSTVINSIGPIVIAAIWVPWEGNAETTDRIAQMWVVGLIVGLCDGFVGRSHENRLQKRQIKDLAELMPRTPEHKAFKVWQAVCWSSVQAAMFYVFMREITDPTNNLTDKGEISAMYSGFVYSSASSLLNHFSWNFQERIKIKNPTCCRKLKDRRVIQQILPRIGGVSYVYIYLAIANTIAMNSQASRTNCEDRFYCAFDFMGWFAYGVGMGTEFANTLEDRFRGISHKVPTMALWNGVATIINQMRGRI